MKSIVKNAVTGKGKSRGAVWCGVVLGFLVAVAGCERLEPVDTGKGNTDLVCKDITSSDCKGEVKNENRSSVQVEYKGKCLYITHKDLLLNCCKEGVNVTVSVTGSTIELNIEETYSEEGGPCRCICPFDISYSVGEFEEGTYVLIIKCHNQQIHSQTVVF